ncbi:transmembrane channel-like protein 7 [Euwallacea fornicatus]|uniref:transmembrane channel-like protein 7 n=1 Tax=Euwallacea fornicatus TaxID=995702 RepID=UPI00338D6BCB
MYKRNNNSYFQRTPFQAVNEEDLKVSIGGLKVAVQAQASGWEPSSPCKKEAEYYDLDDADDQSTESLRYATLSTNGGLREAFVDQFLDTRDEANIKNLQIDHHQQKILNDNTDTSITHTDNMPSDLEAEKNNMTAYKNCSELNHNTAYDNVGYDFISDGNIIHRHATIIVSKMEKDHTLMENTPEAEELRRTALRDMPQSLTLKRCVKDKLSKSVSGKSNKKSLTVWRTFKYRTSMAFAKLKLDIKDLGYSLELWYGPLKQIEGNFGTGVASFFKFLRWLFILNLLMALISVGFIVMPKVTQDTYQQTYDWHISDIITGQGYLTHTPMYYGFYSNQTLGSHSLPYSMPHAYFFTMLSIYFVSFLVIGVSAARSYRKSFIETEGGLKNVFATKIFCGWDYNIATKDAANLKSRSLYNELKELDWEFAKQKRIKTFCDRFRILGTQTFMNVLVLCVIAGTGITIWFFLHNVFKDLRVVIAPVMINAVMTIMPMFLSFIVRYEDYKNPKISIYFTLARTFLLGVTCIGVLIAYWLKNVRDYECWETSLAQEFYRMIIFDFIISVGCTALLDIFMFLIYKYYTKNIHLEFDIAWNTVQIIYNQSLFWVGLVFSPLLPVVIVIKLFLIWYIRYLIAIYLCKPSAKSWRAAQTSTWFLVMTFLSLLCIGGLICYVISNIDTSVNCGPFRNYKYIYEMVTLGILNLESNSTVWFVVLLVTKPGVIAINLLFLCALVYYSRAKANAEKEIVAQYRHMLRLSASDKKRCNQLLSDVTKGRWQFESNNRLFNPELYSPETAIAGEIGVNSTDEIPGPSTSYAKRFNGGAHSSQYSRAKKYT